MNERTRNIALSIIILAGMAGLGYIWMNYGSNPDVQEAPTLSKTAAGKIQLDGFLTSEKTADLGFINPATITSIAKKVGDQVKTGEVLAVQDGADIKAQVGTAEAQLQSARTELDKLNHDLKVEKLKVHDLSGNAKKVQKAQVSSSEDSVEMQKSAIFGAQDSVISAKAQLAKTVLRAPFDGVITRQDGEVGEVGGASVPSFMTVASSEPLRKISAFASDLDVASIKVGDTAQISFDVTGTQKTISAKVTTIDPSTDSSQNKMAYKVILMLDDTDSALKSGMHASVTF